MRAQLERLLFGFKKPVDDEGVPFERRPAGTAGCLAAHDGRAGIDCEQGGVRKRHFAAVRNPARIDRAMAGPQPRAGGTNVAPCPVIGAAASAGPINRDSREHRLLAGKPRWRHEQHKNKSQ